MQRDPEKTPIEKSNNASVLQLNFNPYTSLQTERLNLRQITMADAEDYFLVRSSSEAMKFIGKPLHQSIEETKELIKKIEGGINTNEAIAWALSLKENPKLFGTIGYHRIEKENFRAEIGYMILPEYWNKGLVSEAIKENSVLKKCNCIVSKLKLIRIILVLQKCLRNQDLPKTRTLKRIFFTMENFRIQRFTLY
jgi:ribosomal-protein-alanine N-acetyltransferase